MTDLDIISLVPNLQNIKDLTLCSDNIDLIRLNLKENIILFKEYIETEIKNDKYLAILKIT